MNSDTYNIKYIPCLIQKAGVSQGGVTGIICVNIDKNRLFAGIAGCCHMDHRAASDP